MARSIDNLKQATFPVKENDITVFLWSGNQFHKVLRKDVIKAWSQILGSDIQDRAQIISGI